MWLARCRQSGAQYVLDTIVERKSINDLVARYDQPLLLVDLWWQGSHW